MQKLGYDLSSQINEPTSGHEKQKEDKDGGNQRQRASHGEDECEKV